MVQINFVGVLNGARIGHAYLKRASGCLLNTASASAIYGSAGLATYSATKFGVRALTEALDGEWHADGIRVRSIVPGFIDTPLLSHMDQDQRSWLIGKHPIGRLGRSEEISGLVLFLLSDHASFITGSYHLVDGGYTAP